MLAAAALTRWLCSRAADDNADRIRHTASLGTGQRLYEKAKGLIPGGTGLLSKRPEMFLPEQWPAYYAKAEGAYVWDLDGNRFVDMICSPGCFTLGAADPDVNAAVCAAVRRGSFSTLNCPEEVELAETLISLHPWAAGGKVRFARGGGEIDMIAVRIARAHTGRDRVAICGYHGWTDWYLAANLGTKGKPAVDRLGRHWLADVAPCGVPAHLAGTTVTWDYGDVDSLAAVLERHPGEFAAVVLEPGRDGRAPEGFLEAVRALADKHGALLIFDEVSSAFRETLGGIHLKLGVNPDLATFSKTMSNGFAMAAVVGRAEPMASAQGTFISTTYHTERVGPVAALATIHKFREADVQRVNCERGRRVRAGWLAAADAAGLGVSLALSLDCWPAFAWRGVDGGGKEASLVLTTLFTQEMLGLGYLATTSVAIGFAHTDDVLDGYLAACATVFARLKRWLDACGGDGAACRRFLKGPVKHGGFQRV